MKTQNTIETISRRTVFFTAALALFALQPLRAQEYHFNPEHRRPIEATLADLQGIESRHSFHHEQQERYDHAILHLQQFAERLHERGWFDKAKLDEAIGDVQSVIDHNPMGEEGHRRLVHDVTELRRLRQHFDDRDYRYEP